MKYNNQQPARDNLLEEQPGGANDTRRECKSDWLENWNWSGNILIRKPRVILQLQTNSLCSVSSGLAGRSAGSWGESPRWCRPRGGGRRSPSCPARPRAEWCWTRSDSWNRTSDYSSSHSLLPGKRKFRCYTEAVTKSKVYKSFHWLGQPTIEVRQRKQKEESFDESDVEQDGGETRVGQPSLEEAGKNLQPVVLLSVHVLLPVGLLEDPRDGVRHLQLLSSCCSITLWPCQHSVVNKIKCKYFSREEELT